MGVDFGSSFLKVSIARPGKGIELVTNEQSKRKTPAAVGFTTEGERLFGDAALSYAAKAPDRVILYGRDYLGSCKNRGDKKCEKRKKVVEGVGEFGGEQIVAMLLGLARKQAAVALEGKVDAKAEVIKDCVVTVPTWFGVEERGELLDAAELIGLNVLSLINTPTAAALKYALDNKGMKVLVEDGGGEDKVGSLLKQKILIYDMGASSVSASVVEITGNVKKKRATKVSVLAHEATRGVSGRALDDIVVERLCKDFDAMRNGKGDKCAMLPRVLVRLRKAGQKAREVLSANTDAFVNVPSLHDDWDFKTTLKRSDFEEAATKLFESGEKPVQRALSSVSLTGKIVDAVVPVGGASRTPKVQEGLLKVTERESLNKSLNADEAAVFGAAYFAASLSSTFRVRDIALHDVQPYSISARIDRDKKKGGFFSRNEKEAAVDSQIVKIFESNGKVPARKSVTLKRSGDFGVTVFLDDGKETLLSKFQVTNVEKVLKKVTDKKLASSVTPKVSLTFQLDSSGMVKVSAAEAAVDESITVTYTPSPSPAASKKPKESHSDKDNKDKVEEKEEKEAAESPSAKPSPTTKIQTVVRRETVTITYDKDAVISANGRLSVEEKKAAGKFLRDLESADTERVKVADALNSLESAILTTRSKIREAHDAAEDEEDEKIAILNKVSTPEERTTVLDLIDSAENWMFEEASHTMSGISEKMDSLKKATANMFTRADEHKKRPEMVATFQTAMKSMKSSHEPLRSLHVERKSSHVSTFDEFAKSLASAEEWLESKLKEQDKLALTDKPVFSTQDLEEKSKKLFMDFASLGRLKVPDAPAPSPSAVLDDEKQATDSVENETSKSKDANDQPKVEPVIDGDTAKADAGGVGDVKDEL